MHIKAIPADISKFAGAHPLMVGAAVVAIVAGGLYLRSGSTAADAMPGGAFSTDADYSSFSYTVPSLLPNQGGGGGMGGGIVDSMTAAQGAGGLSSNDSALLAFEYYKEDHSFALSTTDLSNQIAIAGLNADIARASVDASLYATNASLASSWMQSNSQFSSGSIGNLTFAFLGTGRNEGNRGTGQRYTQNFNSLLGNSTIQSILGLGSSSTTAPVSASGALSYEAQSAAGNSTVVAYGGATVTPATQSGTSGGATSVTSGSSSGSTFVAANDTSSYAASPTLRSANASLA